MYIINVEMTFGTRQSNAVRFFNADAYLVDLSWLVWKFNKTQNVSLFSCCCSRGVPCVSSHRNFVWSIVDALSLFCARSCAREYAYTTCVSIFMHWNINIKKEVILLNCVRGTLYKCNICKEYARFSRHLSLPLSFSSMEFVAVWSGTDFIWFTLHANHVPNTKRTKFQTNVAVREQQSEKKTIWKFVTPLHRLTWEFFRPKFPNEI